MAGREAVDGQAHADQILLAVPLRAFDKEPARQGAVDLGKGKRLGVAVVPAQAHEGAHIVAEFLFQAQA